MLLVLIFYIFVYYFFFLSTNIGFLSAQSSLQTYNVTIATTNYPIITQDTQTFQTQFNKTARTVSALVSLNCLIDGYNGNPVYSDYLINKPSGWVFFMVASLLSFILIVAFKAWQTYAFDLTKTIYNWDHSINNFNITNYIVYNLSFCCLIYGHYYLFNMMFTGQLSPCVGSQYYYQSTATLFNDKDKVIIG